MTKRRVYRIGGNALGHLRVMFTVEDIDDTVARLRRPGGKVVGDRIKLILHKMPADSCNIDHSNLLAIGLLPYFSNPDSKLLR